MVFSICIINHVIHIKIHIFKILITQFEINFYTNIYLQTRVRLNIIKWHDYDLTITISFISHRLNLKLWNNL